MRKILTTKNLLEQVNIKVYDNIWNTVKGQFIEFAFKYRLKHDILFRNIIESLKKENDTYEYVYAPKIL